MSKNTGEIEFAPDAEEFDENADFNPNVLDDVTAPDTSEQVEEEQEQQEEEQQIAGTSLDEYFLENDEGTGESSGETDLPNQSEEESEVQEEPATDETEGTISTKLPKRKRKLKTFIVKTPDGIFSVQSHA